MNLADALIIVGQHTPLQPKPKKPEKIEPKKEPKMNEQQWEEVKIEDVQPGDVARCNGREFPIVSVQDHAMTIRAPGMDRYIVRPLYLELGFTFWRKVKREPRTFREFAVVNSRGTLAGTRRIKADAEGFARSIDGAFFLADITEILDGEDGA